MIYYLLDENTPNLYISTLSKREPTMVIWKVGDPNVPSRGTLDPDILVWCEEHGFILITNNRRSMPRHLDEHLAQGRHIPGIFIINPKMGIGGTIEELLRIWRAGDADRFEDTIVYLPASDY